MLKVFSVYDVKAEYYKKPFMMRATGEAVRSFMDAANNKEIEIGMHPEDFTLFYIADYDEEHGNYINKTPHEPLGIAIEYVKMTEK